MKRDPYKYVHFGKGRPRERIFLSKDELRIIEEHQPQKQWTWRAKQIAIICCYTGVAYADLMTIDWKSHKEVHGKKCILDHHRQKTGVLEPIIINDKVSAALEELDWVIPRLSNHEMNSFLRDLLNDCGIHKPVTMHCLRHTYATLLLQSGVGVYTTSKLLP